MTSARMELGATAGFRQVDVEGIKLAYNDDSDGPAIVCLHAIAHGATDFALLREHLAGRNRMIALDWPGHGNSESDHEPASAGRYAEVLAGFMDAARVDRAVLIGNSIGGAAAIRFASSHPERVAGLVLENPGGLDAANGLLIRLGLGVLIKFFRAGSRSAWWFPAAYRAYYGRVLSNPNAAAQRAKIVAAGVEMAPVLTQAWSSFAAPDADIRALVPEIKCPVLAAWARNDQLVQWKRNESVVRKFPDLRVELFDAGHAAHLETPNEFAAALDRFLSEIEWSADPAIDGAAAG